MAQTPPAPTTGTDKASAGRYRLPKIFGYDFFISFKLGVPPVGAQSYASDLARRLRERDYAVFYSEEEAPPGQELDSTLTNALRRSRILVVVANAGALLESIWVRKEAEQFRQRHPKRPIVPIDVGGAIKSHGAKVDAQRWLDEKCIWLDETEQAVQDGIVSPSLLQRLEITPRFLRANLLFRLLVAGVMASLIALAGFAWYKSAESHERLVSFNLNQGRVALTGGRALEAAPSLLRVLDLGADTPDARFMLARAMASLDAQVARFEASALAFAPDGDRFAVALSNGRVEVWRVSDMKVVATLQQPLAGTRALAFSPDGQRLFVTSTTSDPSSAADDTSRECGPDVHAPAVAVTLWDAASGERLHEFPAKSGQECWKTFLAEGGRVLAIAGWKPQRTDLYWHAATFQAMAPYEPMARTESDPADRRCRWSSASGERASDEDDCPGRVAGTSDDGSIMAIAPWDLQQRELPLWRVNRAAGKALALGRDAEILNASFSPASDRVAITLVDRVEIWDSAAGRRLVSIALEAAQVPARFSADGNRLVAVTAERNAVVFDTASGQRLALLSGHSAPIRSAVFSADGTRVLTAGDDTVARIWDAWTGRLLLTLEGHAAALMGAEFSPDDRFVVTREAGQIRLWDSRPPALPRTLREDPSWVRWWEPSHAELLDWSEDGSQVLLKHLDTGGEVSILWNTRSGLLAGLWRNTEPPPLRPKPASGPTSPTPSPCPSDNVYPLAADDDGRRVLLAEGKNAIVRARAGDCRPVRLEGHGAAVSAAAFDPGSDRVLTADDDGAVRIWNATSGRSLSVLHGERYPTKASFLPGHLAVVIDRRHTAVIWDVSVEQRPIAELKRLLHCSGSVPRESLSDLPPDDTECPPIRSPSEEPAAAANALQASGWGRRNDPAWSEARLRAASALYRRSGDRFGGALAALGRQEVARATGNMEAVRSRGVEVRELIAALDQTRGQADRLLRLGELAFNDFGDPETARLAFATARARVPNDPIAALAEWETSSLGAPPELEGGRFIRYWTAVWMAKRLAGAPAEDDAFGVWNCYAGSLVNPAFERLDFRGLQRVIADPRVRRANRDEILAVLAVLQLPGDQGNELKSRLRVPEGRDVVGP